MKRWFMLFCAVCIVLTPFSAFSAQISRQHQATIINGGVVNATDLSDEYDSLVNESNSQDVRLNTLETLNKGSRSSDPAGLQPGNFWYNTTLGTFRARYASTTKTFATSDDITSVQSDNLTTLNTLKLLYPNFVSGKPPEYTSANVITLRSGLRAADDTNSNVIILPSDLTVSLATSGANGLDTGTEAASTWYYVWLIRKSSDGTVAALFSTSRTAPTLPSGYDQKTRLKMAIRNDASSNILPFLVSSGWPYAPEIIYTSHDYGVTPYRVLTNGTSTTFAAVSLATVIPPISRLAHMTITGVTFSPAGAYIRPTGSGLTNGRIVSFRGNSSVMTEHASDVPTDSSQSIDYKVVDNGLNIDIYGFVITD